MQLTPGCKPKKKGRKEKIAVLRFTTFFTDGVMNSP